MAPKLNFFSKSKTAAAKVGESSKASLSTSSSKQDGHHSAKEILDSSSPTPILTEKIKLGLNVATALHINRGDLVATINGPDSSAIFKALELPSTPEIKSALTKIIEANYTQINNLAVRNFNRPDLKSLAYEISNAQALRANDVKTLSKELISVLEGGDNYTKLAKVYRDYAPRVSKTTTSPSQPEESVSAFPPAAKQDTKNEKDSKESPKKSSDDTPADTSAKEDSGGKTQESERPSSDTSAKEDSGGKTEKREQSSDKQKSITPASKDTEFIPPPPTAPSSTQTTAPSTPSTADQPSPNQSSSPPSPSQKFFRQQIREYLKPKFTNAKATAKNAINTTGRTTKQIARSFGQKATNASKNISSGAKTAGRGLVDAGRTTGKSLSTAGKTAGRGLAKAGQAAAKAGKAGAKAAAQAGKALAQLAGRLGPMIASNPYAAAAIGTIIIVIAIIVVIIFIFKGIFNLILTGNQAPINSYEPNSCLSTMKKTATPTHVNHPITDSSSDKTVTYKFEIATQGDAKIISCQDTLSIQCSGEEKSECPTISDPHAIQDEVCSKIQAASGSINIEAKYDLPNGNNYTLVNTLTLQVECTGCGSGGNSGSEGTASCNNIPESIRTKMCSYSDWDCEIMLAIACAESTMNCKANNAGLNENGTVDKGLLQINSVHKDKFEPRGGDACLYDCSCNIDIGHQVWKEQGYTAWSVYKSGAYKEHLNKTANSTPTSSNPTSSSSSTTSESSSSGTSSSCNGEKKIETLTAIAMTCVGEEKNCNCGPMPLPGVPPAPAPQGMGTVIAVKEGQAITSFAQYEPESYGSPSCTVGGFDVCARGCGPSATVLIAESFNGELCHFQYLTRAIAAGGAENSSYSSSNICQAATGAFGLQCSQVGQGSSQEQLKQKIIQHLDSGAMIVAITGTTDGDTPFCNTKTLNSGGGHWIALVKHEVVNGQDYILVTESGSPAKRVGLHPINTVTCDMRRGGTMAVISR
jgi:hypothetical protein